MEIKDNRKKGQKTLFWLFLRQIIGIACSVGVEALLFVSLFGVGMNTGFILPANYSENYLRQNAGRIAESEPFDSSLLLSDCVYGLFDKEGNYKSGNISEGLQGKIGKIIRGEQENVYNLLLIERGDGYCGVRYTIAARFANERLQTWFPHIEGVMVGLFLLVLCVIIFIHAMIFGRRLKREMVPLFEEIKQVKEQELEFTQRESSIKEVQDVLLALHDMKSALSASLQAEWQTEQRRKENISAIAHDIKTPLTIIRGNAELMREEEALEENFGQLDSILQNAEKIQNYIELLMAEVSGKSAGEKKSKVRLADLQQALEQECRELAEAKQMPILVERKETEQWVLADGEVLQRAVMNLVANGLEHTSKEKGICVRFRCDMPCFCVEIEDFGEGFSGQALRHATEPLFMERQERSGGHYGMGMYFAGKVAEQYEGKLVFKNKEKQGAVVTFSVVLNSAE